ncbi:hypothetical protein COOONC_00715 [Cooperia oncophora]
MQEEAYRLGWTGSFTLPPTAECSTQMLSSTVPLSALSRRTKTVIGVGIGLVIFGFLVQRWFRREKRSVATKSSRSNDTCSEDVQHDTFQRFDRAGNAFHRGSSRLRCTPSLTERGNGRGGSRQRNHFSTSLEPYPVSGKSNSFM